MPVVVQERFGTGYPVAAWAEAKQNEMHQRQVRELQQTVRLRPEDEEFFRQLPRPVRLLVINEECGSSTQAIGVLLALQEAAGDRLDIRVFEKSEAPDLMQRYLKEGQYESVPVVIALDEAMEEAAVMWEHPADFDRFIQQHRQDFVAGTGKESWDALTHDEVVGWVASYRAYRDGHQGEINQTYIDEFRRLVTAAL